MLDLNVEVPAEIFNILTGVCHMGMPHPAQSDSQLEAHVVTPKTGPLDP